MKRFFSILAVAAIAVVAAVSCKKEQGPGVVALDGIELSETTLNLLTGDEATLTVTYKPADVTVKPTVAWSTSNAKVATVDKGVVTAVGAGTATITAKVGTKTATCAVTVAIKPVPATAIVLSSETLSLEVGAEETLTATVTPDNSTDQVAWSTSDEAIATVENGKVTAVAEGVAVITATAGEVSATCEVTVYTPVVKLTVTEFAALADDAEGVVEGVVAAVASKGVVITDGTTNLYVYQPATTPAAGDSVTVKATKTTYYKLIETKSGAELSVINSGNDIPNTEAVDITSTFDAYPDETHASDLLKVQGNVSVSGSYTNLIVEGATARQGSLQGLDLSAYDGKYVELGGYYLGTSGTGGKFLVIVVTSVEEAEAPVKDPEIDLTSFAALDWSNKNAAAWYKFAQNYALPEGFTFILHFYPNSLSAGQRLGNFGKADESPCNMLRFGERTDKAELEWMVDTGAGRQKIYAAGFKAEAWNAIALTAGADGYKFYANGELKGSGEYAYNTNMGFGAIEFANSWGSSWRSAFNGRIALMSVYNRALSADEVAANIFAVPTSDACVGFWPMTEGEGGLLKAFPTKAINEDIDLTKCTRTDNESDYITVDVTSSVAWTTGNTFSSSSSEDPAAESFVKVTSTSDITSGDKYLFVYETENVAFNGGLSTLDAAKNTIEVTINEGVIAADEKTKAAAFTIDLTQGTILSASGFYISSGGSYSNGLKQSATAEANYLNHSVTISDGNVIASLERDNSGSTGYMILNFNANSSDKRFRYYKGGSQKAIQLYKLVEAE